jgi:hypothetical protein
METLDEDLTSKTAIIDNENYLLTYFGPQSDYYLERYKTYHAGSKYTFNQASFFCGIFWFLYRKLFIHFLVAVVILLATSVLQDFLFGLLQISQKGQSILNMGINIGTWVLLGYCGNYFYILQTDRNVSRILDSTGDEEKRLELLKEKGGISYAPFYVLGAIIILLLFTLL